MCCKPVNLKSGHVPGCSLCLYHFKFSYFWEDFVYLRDFDIIVICSDHILANNFMLLMNFFFAKGHFKNTHECAHTSPLVHLALVRA